MRYHQSARIYPRGSGTIAWRFKTVLLKCTQYFLFTRDRPDRAVIKEEWIAAAVVNPLCREKQSDGRVRHWIWVEDAHRYLRVILLEDGQTVHNAFFDRGFRKE